MGERLALTPKLICWELTRLICNELRAAEDSWKTVDHQQTIFAHESARGLRVAVGVFPMCASIAMNGRRADIDIGGADKYLPLDAFSVRFLQPAAAVLANCVRRPKPATIETHLL